MKGSTNETLWQLNPTSLIFERTSQGDSGLDADAVERMSKMCARAVEGEVHAGKPWLSRTLRFKRFAVCFRLGVPDGVDPETWANEIDEKMGAPKKPMEDWHTATFLAFNQIGRASDENILKDNVELLLSRIRGTPISECHAMVLCGKVF